MADTMEDTDIGTLTMDIAMMTVPHAQPIGLLELPKLNSQRKFPQRGTQIGQAPKASVSGAAK